MNHDRLPRSAPRAIALPLVLASALPLAAPAGAQTPCAFDRIELPASVAGDGDEVGTDVAVSGPFLAVGVPGFDSGVSPCEAPGPGALVDVGLVAVYERDDLLQYRVSDFLGGDPVPGERFGASLAFEGDVLVVGAPGSVFGPTLPTPGAVYVFERDPVANAFVLAQPRLVAPTPTPGEEFGFSVALEGDRLLVGAPGGVGEVHFYERDPATGDFVSAGAPLRAANPPTLGRFGHALALQGNELFVGAPSEGKVSGPASLDGLGAAYRFQYRPVPGWIQRNRLVSGNTVSLEQFGNALAISGNTLAVGSFTAQSGFLTLPGRVLLFQREDKGTPKLGDDTWRKVQVLEPAAPVNKHRFGNDLDLDGDLLVVGGPWNTQPEAPPGLAYVFDRVGGTWTERQVLASPDPPACCEPMFGQPFGDRFGYAVHLTRGPGAADRGVFVTALRAHTDLVPCCPDGAGGLEACSDPDPPVSVPRLSGAVYRYRLSLASCERSLTVTGGGTHDLALDAGPAHSGRFYRVLGSLTGVAPGTAVDDVLLPLDTDAYSLFVLDAPGSAPFDGFAGFLDGGGRAGASVTLPAASDPALAGTVLYHAAGVFELSTPAMVLATNAVELELRP